MSNSNHNPKSCQGQMVNGTSAVSIVKFMVDPWMLKMTNVAKELYRIEDWASNAAVLRLASPKMYQKCLTSILTMLGTVQS